VSNPHVSKIHGNYLHSLSTLLPWAEKEINCLEDEIQFTEVMADLVQTHADTITILARGFLEARKYISGKEVTDYLDEHLRARIGTRLIAEQHITLHMSSQPHNELTTKSEDGVEKEVKKDSDPDASYIGVIDTKLSPAMIIRNCESTVGDICEFRYGVRPTVTINGDADYIFAHIPMHLEYIITELLKNAFRATVERGMEREPIEITIAPLPEGATPRGSEHSVSNVDQGAVDLASNRLSGYSGKSTLRDSMIRPLQESTPGVTIRIRDRGGGISPENYKHIWDYSFTTFNEDEATDSLSSATAGSDAFNAISGATGGSSIAGLGYGLPLGRAYAEYFGGGIAVQSLWGWGTDVYLSLRGVGNVEIKNG